VLLNFVSNAIKYNRRGGWVEVTATIRDGGCRIAVQDSGPGLRREEMERLFAPFERLSAATSDVEGTGLGLALSKSLTEAMGGRIGVASKVGKGSTFWVELPLESGGGAVPALAGAETSSTAEVEVTASPMRAWWDTAPPGRRRRRACRRGGRSGGRRALRASATRVPLGPSSPRGHVPGSVPVWAMVATVSTRTTKTPSTSVPAAVTSSTALPATPVRGHSYSGASSLGRWNMIRVTRR